MNEYKYRVFDSDNHVLAEFTSLNNAIIFVKGYMNEYYAESNLSIRIERYDDRCKVNEDADDKV